MWTLAYTTTNQRAPDNFLTPGQCGGMCGVWLANMYKRSSNGTLAQTRPNSRVATDTHLAGLRVAAARWPGTQTPVERLRRLPPAAANMRYVAAAGLKPGPVKSAQWTDLGNWLAQSRASGGYFIDVGGHAIATFVNWKRFASYEKKRRLYYFDPQHGCFYWEAGYSFNEKFQELVREHTGKNRLLEHWWSYFKVFDVNAENEDEADIDISPLFG